MLKFFVFSFLISVLAFAKLPAEFLNKKPKLVLVVVIDQFRADYLSRFSSRFLPAKSGKKIGGFRYLMENGAYFPHAEYGLLQNMTGPGHSTILSGAYPYQSGIPLNKWFDSENEKKVYCAEDENYQQIGGNLKKDATGTSPRNFLGTTVGDELKNSTASSKVIAIALKDRASIFLGGHRADAAFWLNPEAFRWTSSTFYFPDGRLPTWLEKQNEKIENLKKQKKEWPKFPHPVEIGTKNSLFSPYGIEMTTELASLAIDEYSLGKNKGTDLLALSFSSHDYVGHEHGPNSAEIEEMTVHEDLALSLLFSKLESAVPGGMNEVLVVLTADHGVAPVPEWASKNRLPAGRIDEDKLLENLNLALESKFGKAEPGNWVLKIRELNIYLNRIASAKKKVPQTELEDAVKRFVEKDPAIQMVVTRSEYEQKRLPPGLFGKQLLNSYFPKRSGDVIAILKPMFITSEDGSEHLTGYAYDRTVPLILSGRFIEKGIHATSANIVDIAPTLSFMLGIIPTVMSEGRVLSEIFEK